MILPLEKQVCSPELAEKLKELGAPQDSHFYWYDVDGEMKIWTLKDALHIQFKNHYKKICAAYTVAELGELLPPEIKWGQGFHYLEILRIRGEKKDWYVRYYSQGSGIAPKGKMADTEADARAKMLIHLLENKLISL